jgi:hypothetical protein
MYILHIDIGIDVKKEVDGKRQRERSKDKSKLTCKNEKLGNSQGLRKQALPFTTVEGLSW